MLNAMGLTTCVVLPMIFLFKLVVYILTKTTFYHSAFKLDEIIFIFLLFEFLSFCLIENVTDTAQYKGIWTRG